MLKNTGFLRANSYFLSYVVAFKCICYGGPFGGPREKIAKELSAYQIKRITKPGQHAVGGVAGLRLRVKSTGARSWMLRTMVADKRRDLGLGGYPTVTLE